MIILGDCIVHNEALLKCNKTNSEWRAMETTARNYGLSQLVSKITFDLWSPLGNIDHTVFEVKYPTHLEQKWITTSYGMWHWNVPSWLITIRSREGHQLPDSHKYRSPKSNPRQGKRFTQATINIRYTCYTYLEFRCTILWSIIVLVITKDFVRVWHAAFLNIHPAHRLFPNPCQWTYTVSSA